MKRNLILLLFILCIPAAIAAQIRFSATTERTRIAMGEQAVVVATLLTPGQVSGLSVPPVNPMTDFSLLKTDSRQSSSSSIQIINGKAMQKNEITTQIYYIITPKQAGTFTFPSLSLVINGTDYKTDPILFTVSNEQIANPDVKATLQLSRKSLFPGEQALLTFKIAQRINAQGQSDVRNGFNGALEKIDQAFGKDFALTRLFTNEVASGSERIDGEMYNVFSLKFLFFPLSAGNYKIPAVPFEFQELRRAQRRRASDPFFDDFFGGDIFGGGVQAVPKTVFTAPFTVDIKPLPPPPPGFTGAVGEFSITAVADPVDIPAGESVTLKVTFRGNTRPGNMGDITVPKDDGYELFTPEKQVSVDTGDAGIVTRKTYKYLLIPKAEGRLSIPPVSLVYFDAVKGAYATATSGDITINVSKGKGGAKEQTRYLTQEEIREVGRDIRYLKTDASLKNQNRYVYREPVFFLLYPLPFLLVILSTLFRFQATRKDRNAVLNVRNRALATAIRQLSILRKNASQTKASELLGKVAATVETFIAHKFGIAATGRTLEELREALATVSSNQAVIENLTRFIEQIDAYRFGGATLTDADRLTILSKAESFLRELEQGAAKEKPGMKNIALLFITALVLASSLSAAPVDYWFTEANKAYSEGSFDSAAVLYEKIIGSGIENSTVYFNYGNALYRQKKIGYARLAYERASMLKPGDPDITANIKFLESNIVDRVPEPVRGFLDTLLWNLHTLFSLKTQLWIIFGLLCAISILFSLALFSSRNLRLWFVYLSSIAGIILLAFGGSAGYKIYTSEKIAFAVVTEKSVDAKNEPNGSTVLFTVHEGIKFRIRKTDGEWILVSLPNGVSGWVEKKVAVKI